MGDSKSQGGGIALPRELKLQMFSETPPAPSRSTETSGDGYSRAGSEESEPGWGEVRGEVCAIPFPEGAGYWVTVFDVHTQEVLKKWPAEVVHDPDGKSIHVVHEGNSWTSDRRRKVTLQLRDKHMIALFEWEPVLVDGGR